MYELMVRRWEKGRGVTSIRTMRVRKRDHKKTSGAIQHAQRLSLPLFMIKRWQEICRQKSPISAPCVDKWREEKQI